VRQGLRNNNLLKAEQFAVQAATADESVATSRYFPRILFEEAFSASNSPTRTFMMKLDQGRFTSSDFAISNLNNPGTDTDFRTAISLEQTIYDPAVGYGVKIAAKEREARESSLELRREQVALEVVASYVMVQKARAQLAVAEKGLSNAREHLRLAGIRVGAGTGLKSDELRARTFLAEMEEQEIRTRNTLEIARLRLGKAMGAPSGEAVDISGEFRPAAVSASREELSRSALEHRADLRELERQSEKAELGVGLARSAYYPTVHAGAAFQLNDRSVPFGSDNNSWYAGASLRWELFDGMRRSREREKAGALHSASAEMMEQYRKEVAFQVTESWLRRDEATKRVEVARSAVAYAEEGLRLVQKRFEGALATIVELLDVQTSVNRARAAVVDTEADLVLATAQLAYSAGTLRTEVAP
jgi:outer membrane protein TolC